MKDTIASRLLMVRPSAFSFNPETASSNRFQRSSVSEEEIKKQAIAEFDKVVDILTSKKILLAVWEDKAGLPDSVFPNNWIVTIDDRLALFPMESELRRKERNPEIIDAILSNFYVEELIDLSAFEIENQFLEGTGSMVFDRSNRFIFAGLSSRTNKELLDHFSKLVDYEYLIFETADRFGISIYHTNVMMSIGKDIAVVCLDAIKFDREVVIEKLESAGKRVIPISLDQMENFCGNILQVKNEDSSFWLMSERAFRNFNTDQIDSISASGEIIPLPIDIIEKVGGGSIRCMITEIFLQAQ